MAIYPDKKDGKLTGRFRVELQRGKSRYRRRHDTLAEAKVDETRVIAAWDRGEDAGGTVTPLAAPKHHSIASVTQEARGDLWKGQAGERNAWPHIAEVGRIIGDTTPLDDVDTLLIDKIARELSKAGKSNCTVNRYLSHFRTFCVWAKDRKRMDKQKFADITWAWRKESKGRIRWITRAEEEALRAYLVGKGQERIWDLVKVAIETGCRWGELKTAKLDQINGNRLHLWKTKTDEPRTIPMTQATTDRLTSLIKRGMPTYRNLRSWWARAKTAIGLKNDEDFVFHACRHTCATRLLDAGVDILIIKEWLGHKRLETTQRYTHVKPKNLEAALLRMGEYAVAAE